MSKKKTDPTQTPETPETAASPVATAASETAAPSAAPAASETAAPSAAQEAAAPSAAQEAAAPSATQEASEPPVCKTARLYMVREKRGLNLRPIPSMKPAPLEVLPYQTVVTAIGEVQTVGDTEWLPVRAAGGSAGFVMLRHLETMNDSEEET